MSIKKFRFVSPGVFINEIDQSQLPDLPARMGPVIIGRSTKGPAFTPTIVSSFSEFVELFGEPVAGGNNEDVWRNGNRTAPTYGAYAAQAYLRHSNPVTFVRLLGNNSDNYADNDVGRAGWRTDGRINGASLSSQGGSYGLFVCESGSAGSHGVGEAAGALGTNHTGTLAAVWYINDGFIQLSGTIRLSGSTTTARSSRDIVSGTSVMIQNVAAQEWKAVIRDNSNNVIVKSAFNFDYNSDKHIRKVFNTNPTLVNDEVHSNPGVNYWLGESFERSVAEHLTGSGAAGTQYAFIAALATSSAPVEPGLEASGEYSSHKKENFPGQSGWFISQDVASKSDAENYDARDTNRAKKLFNLIGLDNGEWLQNNLKVSIEDIKPAKSDKNWPSFTVTLRKIEDNDKNPKIVEKFTNCNLNPNSPNYIARKIGDKYTKYSKSDRRLLTVGNYDNVSRYVRVETSASQYTKEVLPFGVYGPPRYNTVLVGSGTRGRLLADSTGPNLAYGMTDGNGKLGTTGSVASYVLAGALTDIANNTAAVGRHLFFPKAADYTKTAAEGLDEIYPHSRGDGQDVTAGEVIVGHARFTGSFVFPAVPLRLSGTDGGLIDQTRAYWGADTTRFGSTDTRFDPSVKDIVRTKPDQTSLETLDFAGNTNAGYSWVFTLDDLKYVTATAGTNSSTGDAWIWASGSRQATNSFTAKSGSSHLLTGSNAGINKFTTVFYGGHDGLNIMEPEPFNNTELDGYDETTSYAYYSINKAIELVKEPDFVECNLMSIPGVKSKVLTERLIDVCEERGDALAIIDIEKDFIPSTESTAADNADSRQGNVDDAVQYLKDRAIDSSYGACYYPWVQIRDTFNSNIVWVPPSVVALGAMAYSETVKDVWFAPAGFARGGLTATQAGGLPVVGVNQQLSSKQRDKLYEVGINPIAQFPAEGIVIFGQKTLQVVPSALDRINVRRLLIFLKKEISRIAATTLFEQNVQATWTAFSAQADALLSSVKLRLGLADYKLVLDETTTTPELVDRNIMYAKVFLKPARSIEFIALDFIVTRSGASFED